MRKIKNWEKFNEKPFRVLDEIPKKGDYFIFNDEGKIIKCNSTKVYPSGVWINYSLNGDACKKIIFDDSVKMSFDEEKFPIVKTTPPNLKKGDTIYFLYGYDLMKGVVDSIGQKNVKLNFYSYGGRNLNTKFVPFDKVAEPDEEIGVVWQQWKGIEGSYRIERELYPEYRRPAKNWPFQAQISEEHYGELTEHQILDYTDGKKTY